MIHIKDVLELTDTQVRIHELRTDPA